MQQDSSCCACRCDACRNMEKRVMKTNMDIKQLTHAWKPYLDDRGDEAAVRHCNRNGNVDVLIVCDALAISRACCTRHKR